MKSFVEVKPDSDFSIYNLPYGVFSTESNPKKRIGVAIGEYILNLTAVAHLYPNEVQDALKAEVLNKLMSYDRSVWRTVRTTTQNLLLNGSELHQNKDLQNVALVEQRIAKMYVPADIGDYTDFFSSREHAMNCGQIFRGNAQLLPNWSYLPVAYHGRASSIVVSGTPIRRPTAQIPGGAEGAPIFAPCRMQDYELEMAFYVGGKLNQLGERIPANQASEYIFGFSLMNDWSARDVQKWETVPLGPFTAKNLGTTLSPWIVTTDALAPFLVDNVAQDPKPFPFLHHDEPFNFDIKLSVAIKPQNDVETIVCESNFKYLYWTPLQQLAHHTQSGCNMRPGDVLASGTISGQTLESRACLLERTWNGTQVVQLAGGKTRTFLEDGDEVIMRAYSEKDGIRVGFGESAGVLLPATPL